MYQEERLLAILRHLERNHRISVQEICDMFQVSRDTARRDLVKLSERNAIIRTRGGAVLPVLEKKLDSYKARLDLKTGSKERIGQAAARMIKDNDYVMMNTSTTLQFAAQALEAEKLVAVTNSIDIANILSGKEGIRLHMLGGIFHLHSRYIYGAETVRKLQEYRVDKCLMGGGGITEEGIFMQDEEDGQVVKEMIASSEQVIVLADHTKLGKQYFYKVCGLDEINVLITDQLPSYWQDILEKAEVEWVIAD